MLRTVKKYLSHAIFWILLVFLLFNSFGRWLRYDDTSGELAYRIIYDYDILIGFIIDVLIKAVMFYLVEYLSSKTWKRKRLTLATVFLLSLLLEYVIWTIYQALSSEASDLMADYLLPFSIVFHFLIFFLAIGYEANKRKKQQQEEVLLLKNEKIKTEMALLKSQINPHFMFNTLNNIYSFSQNKEQELVSKSIAKLAGIMRYMTYDTSQDEVTLKKEVEYIKSYIDLQKLRLSTTELVEFNSNIGNLEQRIAPMLFIPFIENAFKYGALSGDIKVELNDEFGKITMEVRNKVNEIGNVSQNGFGIKQARNRLEFLYPDRHSLDLKEEYDYFIAKLSIKL